MKNRRLLIAAVLWALVGSSWAQAQDLPVIGITVNDLTTGQPISPGQTVDAGDRFQITVTTIMGVDCAGQFVVTALGADGAPPSVLVQSVPFIIGPAVGSNAVTSGELTASVGSDGGNDWKVSASCNGATPNAFGFDSFDFFAQSPSETAGKPSRTGGARAR